MTNIEKQIGSLLLNHDCVVVPGLGGFVANYQPAVIHPDFHTFSPPSRQLVFNARLCNNDGLLASTLSANLGITYAEAIRLIEKEVSHYLSRMSIGDKIELNGVGQLFADKENNLQFLPKNDLNFLDDAFGLSSFTSQPIERTSMHEKLSRKLTAKKAVPTMRRLPKALARAAVMLPLAALAVWGIMNTNSVSRLTNGNASLWPSSVESPTMKPVIRHAVKPVESTYQATASEIKTVAPPVTEITETTMDEAIAQHEVYFIIAGAFGVESNAINLVSALKSKGFDAKIIGQNNQGLHLVSLQGFSEKNPAIEKLNSLRQHDFEGAWLLTKR